MLGTNFFGSKDATNFFFGDLVAEGGGPSGFLSCGQPLRLGRTGGGVVDLDLVAAQFPREEQATSLALMAVIWSQSLVGPPQLASVPATRAQLAP